ncbi:MAG: hypothetical protein Q9198_008542, partial [Flavoplaca austrocitrina]
MPNIKIHYQESSEPSPKTDTSHQRTERAMPETNTSETNVSESDRPAPGPYGWSFSGDHWQSFPNSSSRGFDFGGHYGLVRGPEGEKDHVRIDLVFSPPPDSSYTFYGTADFQPKDGNTMERGERGQFEIQGTGTITNMTDGGKFVANFGKVYSRLWKGPARTDCLGSAVLEYLLWRRGSPGMLACRRIMILVSSSP